ncbi:MAG: PqqD family peptide modification chaperone [Cyanobacteria bacterium P01_F01_bin.116]
MTTITLDTVFQRVQTVMESKVGDESMMMDIDKGMYYALNPVSSRIWALLEQPLSAKAVCDHLFEEYAVESSVCQQEVTTFLNQLLAHGILAVVRHETVAPSSITE